MGPINMPQVVERALTQEISQFFKLSQTMWQVIVTTEETHHHVPNGWLAFCIQYLHGHMQYKEPYGFECKGCQQVYTKMERLHDEV